MFKTQSEKSVESFDQLAKKIRESPNTIRDKGTLFEYMTQIYLKQAYPEQFSHVWMLKEVPPRIYIPSKDIYVHIPHKDQGVDLVAQDKNTGDLIGVQVKFYLPGHIVSKNNTNSFVSELGKTWYSSGIWVISNNNLNSNAQDSLINTSKNIEIVDLSDLQSSNIDWSKFDEKHLNDNYNKNLKKSHKKLRYYQLNAVKSASKYYKNHTRGKLIMAPGTGKTFTSLNIAERLQKDQHKQDFYVLYLVPSIQLLSQTLKNWTQDIDNNIDIIQSAVTSDRYATKIDDINSRDICFPATTDSKQLLHDHQIHEENLNPNRKHLFVIFSTYQSIKVIHNIQKQGYQCFNLIIADEAHRTASQQGLFTKVHSNKNVKGKLRLYQTATPKIYTPSVKQESKHYSVLLYSMDNDKIFGKTFYHYGFGQAVDDGYLTDYKVQVLGISDKYINSSIQSDLSKPGIGLSTSDAGKIIGTWNAMVKRNGVSDTIDGKPIKRAIAFTSVNDNQQIKDKGSAVGSRQIANSFNRIINDSLGKNAKGSYHVDIKDVNDNPYSVNEQGHQYLDKNTINKKDCINWLSKPVKPNHAKILSNVRFLSEGIDVPSLNAIIFFAPKSSQIDIVQAIGRIMRLHKGKNFGYIILPVVIPSGEDPKDILNNSHKYKTIWQVLTAIRDTDDRFRADINNLTIKHYKSKRLLFNYINHSPKNVIDGKTYRKYHKTNPIKYHQTSLQFKHYHTMAKAFYGRIIKHVGNRDYLRDWSGKAKTIVKNYSEWIAARLNKRNKKDFNESFNDSFNKYLSGLRYNINNKVSKEQAINMLSQHIVTRPIFNALFGSNKFVNNNPVSRSIQYIIKRLRITTGFHGNQQQLTGFYKYIKQQASDLNNPQAKQDFIKRLYGDFFNITFNSTMRKLGIVFTPTRIVNFIIHSVDYVLRTDFSNYPKGLASKHVHILDPFVGTGTFITEVLYYLNKLYKQRKININDLINKYDNELHCNEIVLLSYYIATINIESVFNEIMYKDTHKKHYDEFKGIVLADTFNSYNRKTSLNNDVFYKNDKRFIHENNLKNIRVIISNPPYNDDKNHIHPTLDNRIKRTYAHSTTGGLYKSAYNRYNEAFRWATDRIKDDNNGEGVIGFVTSAGFLTSNSLRGVRKYLYKDFNYLYIYNLRGNQRLSGEARHREGQPVFQAINGTGGSKTPIAITILVRNRSNIHKIFYGQVKNNLTAKQKLDDVKNKYSIQNINWVEIHPDKNNDWLNKGNPTYQKKLPLSSKHGDSAFNLHAVGVSTNRNAWDYNFSKASLSHNIKIFINHYNSQRQDYLNNDNFKFSPDHKYIKWTRKLKKRLRNNKIITYNPNKLVPSLFRPFTKKWLYYDKDLVESPGQYYNRFGKNNCVIYTTGKGSAKPFSAIATNLIPNLDLSADGQGFMRYDHKREGLLPLHLSQDNVNPKLTKELNLSNNDETFYYIYGILNSPSYKRLYRNDFNKGIARIPVAKSPKPFVDIGKKLMYLHVHYEDVSPYTFKVVSSKKEALLNKKHGYTGIIIIEDHEKGFNYNVTGSLKYMKHTRKHPDIILFNPYITLTNVPKIAYKFIISGKSAIDWILKQYKIQTDKGTKKNPGSYLIDNPNKFNSDPKYVFKLLLKIINVSVKSVHLCNKLKKYTWN